MTTDDVIDALGGVNDFAALVGRSPSWVYKCRQRANGLFPGRADLYRTVTDALAAKGKRASLAVWDCIPQSAIDPTVIAILDGS